MRRWLLLLALASGCQPDTPLPQVDLSLVGQDRLDLSLSVHGVRRVTVDLGGAPFVVEAAVSSGTIRFDDDDGAEARPWLRPRPLAHTRAAFQLAGDGVVTLTVWNRGAPPPASRTERSLTWTDPALLDDRAVIGLSRLMAVVSDDGHGGRMLDAWFRRFASTAHSERAAQAAWMDEVAAQQGADPSTWDLDLLPFTVTGVHNRLDLAPRDGGCGQLRVSLASTHPVYAPFHLIFLFRQTPDPDDDVAPDGTIHCLGTARRWARLGALDGQAWLDAARAILAAGLTRDRFLLAESVELTVSPWEWRQWLPMTGSVPLDNPPLFQTLDTDAINAPGPLRDAFLAFVAANAGALDARTVAFPEWFRPRSAHVPPSSPRTPLDLGGLDAAVAAAHPDLRAHLEICGCPTCHTNDAEFVQTSPQRVFSPFYAKELVARGARLDLMSSGADVPVPPFGPLQP